LDSDDDFYATRDGKKDEDSGSVSIDEDIIAQVVSTLNLLKQAVTV